VLPKRFFEPRVGGYLSDHGLDPEAMDKAKRYYYALMGWDSRGVPLPERGEDLGLE
jgi:aldehyde:ferredoxin oxidoreductase